MRPARRRSSRTPRSACTAGSSSAKRADRTTLTLGASSRRRSASPFTVRSPSPGRAVTCASYVRAGARGQLPLQTLQLRTNGAREREHLLSGAGPRRGARRDPSSSPPAATTTTTPPTTHRGGRRRRRPAGAETTTAGPRRRARPPARTEAMTDTTDGGTGVGGRRRVELAGGDVFVTGSSTVEPISIRVGELAGELSGGGLAVTVEGPGTGDGFATFCAGDADIADASRQINEEEVAACEEDGIEYVELEVAIDGLTVATNPANEAITCLDVPALYALVGPESEGIANWSDAAELATEVASAYADVFPELPLDITGPGEESGTYDTFVEFAIADLAEERGQDEATRADYASSPNDNLIVEGIECSESSLGWVGYAFYAAEQERMKAIEIDGGDGCVAPTPGDDRRRLVPVHPQPLHLRQHGQRRDNPAVASYVDLYLSDEGLATVADAGYVDLPDDRIQADAGRLGRPLTPSGPLASWPAGHPRGGRPRALPDRREGPRDDADDPGPARQPQAAQSRAQDAGVFLAAAIASIVISALILFACCDGAINFMRVIDWDFGAAHRHRLVPASRAVRPADDLRRHVIMGIGRDARRRARSVSATAIYLSEYAPPPRAQVRQADDRGARRHPVRRLRLLRPPLDRPRPRPTALRPAAAPRACSPPASPSGSSSSRSWRRSPRTRCARCRTRCARRATARRRKVTTVFRVVVPAAVSGIVAAFDHLRLAGDRRDDGRHDGRRATTAPGRTTGRPANTGLTMTAAMANAAGGTDPAGRRAVPGAVLRRAAAVPDDARPQPYRRPLRPPLPAEVLRSSTRWRLHHPSRRRARPPATSSRAG